MNVKTIDREPAEVAYLRHTGPYGEPISQFWQRTVYPWLVANALLGHPRYGISHDDPGITAPEQCRYDACVEVPPGTRLPRGTLTTTIPGGRFATARFFGTTAEIGAAWNAVLRDWLPASGYQIDARPCFEYYPREARYDEKTGAFECDICIPLAPL